MSYEPVAVAVRDLSKRYEIYDTPRDRLKQLVIPALLRRLRGSPASSGATAGTAEPRYFREFWALNNVSFDVRRGESFGIIGRNGSGKSTLLQIIAGTLAQTTGDVAIEGRVAALLELGSGFNPEFTGRENVYLNGRILGLSKSEIDERYQRIAEFADIGDFIDQPVKVYSSGMFVRLAFAVQAHIDASVVIIDEALAVGDVFFRQKCYARLEQLRASGAAILLVTHSMPDVEQFCDRALLLDRGNPRFIGAAADATKHYYVLYQGADAAPATSARRVESADARSVRLEHPGRPNPGAFIELAGKSQVSNGQARCIALALSDPDGEPRSAFRQGDDALFYGEYELSGEIGVPIFGVVIFNDRGVIVHGKNSWQYDDEGPRKAAGARHVAFRQQVSLQLAPGEYSFEVGLASVTPHQWDERHRLSHEEWAALYATVCVVTNAGHFSVGFAMRAGVTVLTHHGIADLPGSIETEVIE